MAARNRLSLSLPLSFSPLSYFLSFSIQKFFNKGKRNPKKNRLLHSSSKQLAVLVQFLNLRTFKKSLTKKNTWTRRNGNWNIWLERLMKNLWQEVSDYLPKFILVLAPWPKIPVSASCLTAKIYPPGWWMVFRHMHDAQPTSGAHHLTGSLPSCSV